MEKKISSLEALKDLRDCYTPIHNGLAVSFTKEFFDNKLGIIETALKDYEKKTKLAKKYADVNNVAKRLKALEIIKEKTEYFIDFDENTKTIYIDCALDCDAKQFNLLKEELK